MTKHLYFHLRIGFQHANQCYFEGLAFLHVNPTLNSTDFVIIIFLCG